MILNNSNISTIYLQIIYCLTMPPVGPNVPGSPMSGSFPVVCDGGQSVISTPETAASGGQKLLTEENIRTRGDSFFYHREISVLEHGADRGK